MRPAMLMLAIVFVAPATWAQTSGGLQTTTVTLSVAQLQGLRDTPVTLVASPGAEMAIVPVSGTLEYTFRTHNYAGGHGRFVLTLGPYDSPSPLDVFDDVLTTGFSDQDSDQTVTIQGYPPDPSLSDNLDLEITNFGPPLIDGDGTVTVTVNYNIVSTE